MKKLIFTLLSCMVLSCAFSQTTYYWVGGTATGAWGTAANWNTALDGSGTPRVPANTDVLIFDGTNIGGAVPATGAVSVTVTTITIGKLILQNGADVALSRASSTTSTLTIGDDPSGDDLVVNAGCKLRLKGLAGTLVVLLANNAVVGPPIVPATTSATAKIFGDVILEEGNTTFQNRFTSRLKGAFVFASGSTCTANASYTYYPFSTTGSTLLPVSGGVVFQAGSTYYYQGGLSPFGSNSTSFLTEFQPGSNFYFRAPAVANMFNGRSYGNVFIESNVAADGTLSRIGNFTINAGATYTTHTSGVTPVYGNFVNNGTFTEPADPNRNNRIVMTGETAQTISGTGSYLFADFVVSNQSNVTLQVPLRVDSTTFIYGMLNTSGTNTLTGSGITTVKTASSVNLSGALTAESEVVTAVSSLSGVEIGMSISGTGIAPNTVVVNFSSGSNTITLSKPATATNAAAALLVFNGAGVLPVLFTDERAVFNNNRTNISWVMETQTDVVSYSVERSANGTKFDEIGNINATQNAQYYYTDEKPLAGTNYYRIKATEVAGKIKYSIILKVNTGKGNAALQVYPNPVKNNVANLQPANLDKGSYTVTVFNQSGQKQLSKTIEHAGGSATISLALPAAVKAGMYVLRLDGASTSLKQQLIVQ